MLLTRLKAATPWTLRRLSRRLRRILRERREAHLSRETVFTSIYQNGAWSAPGTAAGRFDSGPGSDPQAAAPYIEAVRSLIAAEGVRRVIDIGCGDFRIGQAIAATGVDYLGVDIVGPLIAHHTRLHASSQVRFLQADMVCDDLPAADLCLVREVFQHLSNAEIQQALARLRHYRLLLITDNQPPPGTRYVANRDKPHGRDVRLFQNSALAFDQPPFNLTGVELLLDVASPNMACRPGERLQSFLVRQ